MKIFVINVLSAFLISYSPIASASNQSIQCKTKEYVSDPTGDHYDSQVFEVNFSTSELAYVSYVSKLNQNITFNVAPSSSESAINADIILSSGRSRITSSSSRSYEKAGDYLLVQLVAAPDNEDHPEFRSLFAMACAIVDKANAQVIWPLAVR